MDRSTPEGRRHKNQQDAGNARCSRGARSSCRPRPCACARPRAASSASRASSCPSRSRPCRRPPARPTTRSPCACGRSARRRRGGGPRLSRGLSRRLDRRLRGSATATEEKDRTRQKRVAKSRVWFRKATPHLATLGSCSWKAQGTRLQGRCGSMNWNVAPFAHCSSASERCRASRSAFSRASLCGPRRRRRRPPRDWRANSFARSISLDRWPSSLFL